MDEDLKLEICAREPIQIPGSIQPHGLLLVLDGDGQILQTAGDSHVLSDQTDLLPGSDVAQVLEGRLDALLRNRRGELGSTPDYVGDLQASPLHPPLTVTAHRVGSLDVVEIEPAGERAPAPALLSFVRASVERMNRAPDLEGACSSIAAAVQQVTGFDRVMIYQFLEDASGSVIAEQKRDDLPAYLHHRYPASDIPPQARELYRRNPIRVIPDVAYAPAPLVPSIVPGARQTLDMSHCSLRSVSPVHLTYLKNMGVGASMSVSILTRGELWGLIACHHGGPRLVPFEVREVCQHLGQSLSHHVEATGAAEQDRQRLELARGRERMFNALAAASDAEAFLRERIADLLALLPAHAVVVSVAGETAALGPVPHRDALAGLVGWVLRSAPRSGVVATDCLSKHYPSAAELTAEASGLVAVVVPQDPPVVVMWLRTEQVEEVHWAGNPHEAVQRDPSNGSLNPRTSFAVWVETVRGRSRPWSPVEVEAAHLLRERATIGLQEFRIRQLNVQIQSANERLAVLVRTDELTGLANRRALDQRLMEEWARLARHGRSLAALAIDVDQFKQLNDHLGHQAGDECLREVAGALGAAGRSSDFAARSGGEEFVVLLPETDLVGALSVAEGVRAAVERLGLRHPTSSSGVVTVSIGVAAARASLLREPEELLHEADTALYSAKRQGRNKVVVAGSREGR